MKAAAFPVEPLQITIPDIEQYCNELEALIVEIQNDNYASPVARMLLTLLGEIVVWQYRSNYVR